MRVCIHVSIMCNWYQHNCQIFLTSRAQKHVMRASHDFVLKATNLIHVLEMMAVLFYKFTTNVYENYKQAVVRICYTLAYECFLKTSCASFGLLSIKVKTHLYDH